MKIWRCFPQNGRFRDQTGGRETTSQNGRVGMYVIRSTINILRLVFTYFIIGLRNLKNVTMILKTVTFLCKKISASWYTTNKEIQIHFKWFN